MQQFDVVIYRATPAGIMAAVASSRLGMRAAIIEPSGRVGGMMTSGLNATDTVEKSLMKGLAREFFERAKEIYGTSYLPVRIESRVSRRIFNHMLTEANVPVIEKVHITQLIRSGRSIKRCVLSNDTTIQGKWWMDASYEGDLLPLGGLDYSLGRESQDTYGEEWGGVRPSSSFLPWKNAAHIPPKHGGDYHTFVSPPTKLPVGAADPSVQSYCIRPTLTNNPKNKVPIEKPHDYGHAGFHLYQELSKTVRQASVTAKWHGGLGTTFKSAYFNLAELPNGKFDMNSGPVAPINSPALTYGWVEASYEKRLKMTQRFRDFTLGVLYFIQNDSNVHFSVQKFFKDFGLPADEYRDSGNFPPDVYVREGRRLVGDKVFTQDDVQNGGVPESDAICMSKYSLDCKPVHWRASRDMTRIVREGMFFSPDPYKYGLPTSVILPKRAQCDNFFSLCGVSASHVAFGSIRMEPTWMELGSAAAMMVHLSTETSLPIHDISGSQIRKLRDSEIMSRYSTDNYVEASVSAQEEHLRDAPVSYA